MPERLVRVGQIAGAFGIRGQMKVQPLTDYAEERFVKGAKLILDGEPIEIESVSVHKGRPLLKIKGVDTMSAAEALQWKYLETEDELVLEQDEYLVSELLGLSVRTEEGEGLGNVDRVLPNPAHEILVVGEIMIPLVEHFVTKIDMRTKTITVRLIPGMRPGEL
ncbi:16S rRNA processing protein RimM [bacterium]|nr:MAG: 16S rRNA processing protein RimM [bacterium]